MSSIKEAAPKSLPVNKRSSKYYYNVLLRCGVAFLLETTTKPRVAYNSLIFRNIRILDKEQDKEDNISKEAKEYADGIEISQDMGSWKIPGGEWRQEIWAKKEQVKIVDAGDRNSAKLLFKLDDTKFREERR